MGGGCSCNVCYQEGKGRERSVILTGISSLLVIAAWPVIGFFRPTNFPYPLTIAMIIDLIIVILGFCLYSIECCYRGFRCCMSAEDQLDIDATEGGEANYQGPITTKLFLKKTTKLVRVFWNVLNNLCLWLLCHFRYLFC